MRALYRIRKTFWGRLAIGPLLAICGTLGSSERRIVNGDLRELPMWLTHGALLAAMTCQIALRIPFNIELAHPLPSGNGSFPD